MQDVIIAGDTLDFDTSVIDADGVQYKASESWAMTLRIIPRTSGTPISVTATASGDDFNVAASAAATASWTPGTYSAVALVSKSGERKTVYLGDLVIKADPGVATTYDVRSDARVALDAARALWYSHSTNRVHVLEYEIAGRRMKFASPADLVKHIKALELEVANEERETRLAAGMGSGRKIQVRFGS